MKISFCIFYLKKLAWISLFISLSGSAAGTLVASQLECKDSPVFAFSRALYLQQYHEAEVSLAQIAIERSAAMRAFFGEVLNFVRAYDTSNVEGQQAALVALDTLITSMQAGDGTQSIHSAIELRNIMVHTARMHLLVGNLVRATRLAKSVARLMEDLDEGSETSGDALLARGLYHYYAGRGDDDFGFLVSLLGLVGDKQLGLELVSQAVQESADYSFEAARSLLSDMAWNRQQTCPYLPYFEGLTNTTKFLPAHYQQQISAYLFCGDAVYALALIDRFEKDADQAQNVLAVDLRNWLSEVRLQARAALGDAEWLEERLALNKKVNELDDYKLRFMLARAYDVRGQHSRARELYTHVQGKAPRGIYKNLAVIYKGTPYRPPVAFNWQDYAPVKVTCNTGEVDIFSTAPATR